MPLLLALLLAIGFAPVDVLSQSPAAISDTTACATRLSPPQPDEGDWVYAIVEIPQNSIVKYEVDSETGQLIASRFMEMPVVYPGNYGYFPGTLAGDGDALDVLLLTREALIPGSLIRVRPIGILPMLDRGEEDDKVIAVPDDRVDTTYREIRDISDLPAAEWARINAFFDVYKELRDRPADVVLGEPGSREAAMAAFRAAQANCSR